MSKSNDDTNEVAEENGNSRRRFLAQAGVGAAGLGLTAISATGASAQVTPTVAAGSSVSDERGKAEAISISPHDAALLARVQTPHKSGQLLLAPTFRAGNFDSHAVDVPFVFRGENGFLMTYVGFDGIGYQTGLASSSDLRNWKREGLILGRGATGSSTEFNAALSWIVRDNDLFGTGKLKTFDGDYLGTYHAYPKAGYENGPASIGICRSRDLRSWRVEEPILFAGDGTAWKTADFTNRVWSNITARFICSTTPKTRAQTGLSKPVSQPRPI